MFFCLIPLLFSAYFKLAFSKRLAIASLVQEATMIKALIICFAMLFVQLAVLHVVDARLYASQDVRHTASNAVTPPKKDEEIES